MKTETIGDRWLSAWQVAPGVAWVQTRSPQFTRKLSQRRDSRLVARGVAGGYLRTFEFQRGLAWAGRLIARYQTKCEMLTNARKSRLFTNPGDKPQKPDDDARQLLRARFLWFGRLPPRFVETRSTGDVLLGIESGAGRIQLRLSGRRRIRQSKNPPSSRSLMRHGRACFRAVPSPGLSALRANRR